MLWKSSPADASAGPKNKINLQAKVACEQPRRRLNVRPSSMLEAHGDLSPVRVQGCTEWPNEKGLFDIRWLFNVTQSSSASKLPSEFLLCTLLRHEVAFKHGVELFCCQKLLHTLSSSRGGNKKKQQNVQYCRIEWNYTLVVTKMKHLICKTKNMPCKHLLQLGLFTSVVCNRCSSCYFKC